MIGICSHFLAVAQRLVGLRGTAARALDLS